MVKRKYKIKLGGDNTIQQNIENNLNLSRAIRRENLDHIKMDKANAELANENLKWFRKMVATITKPFRIIFNYLLQFSVWFVNKVLGEGLSVIMSEKYPIAHYITLAIVILLVLGGVTLLFGNSIVRAPAKIVDAVEDVGGNIIVFIFKKMLEYAYRFTKWILEGLYSLVPESIKNFFSKIKSILTPSYKTSLMISGLTGVTKEKVNEEPREEISGRCDDMEYKQLGNGTEGLCSKTIKPKDIQWNINTSNNKEISSGIPSNIVSSLSNEGKKFIVKVPWKQKGMEYVPDCNNMKYSDGSKAELFIDNGNVCKMVEKEQKEYSKVGRYPSTSDKYKGLDQFITENNPICN
jgi:hypothetical protein